MATNNSLKMEVDYSATVDQKIPECELLAGSGKLVEAIEQLSSLEKQTRTSGDMVSTSKILVAIVKMCFTNSDWELLNDQLVAFTRKRSQMKQAVTKMIQAACSYVENTPNMEVKLKLIDTLRQITDGKIYVENERARLTLLLSKIRENEGDFKEAATVLQDLQVETYGTMERREKVEFILEQMRLCLINKDTIRTGIISKKISKKFFADSNTTDLKLKFYRLMIDLDKIEKSFMDICVHYYEIYECFCTSENDEEATEALKCVVLYVILAPYNNQQSDFTHRLQALKKMETMGAYAALLKLFTTNELISWSFLDGQYNQVLRSGLNDIKATDVFVMNEDGDERWKHLKNRVIEHNIRIMSKYYTNITLDCMAQLLSLSQDEVEKFLSELVVNKTVYARIDRLSGRVTFQRQQEASDILNRWSTDLRMLMNSLNKTIHLVNKEEMVHRARKAKASLAGSS